MSVRVERFGDVIRLRMSSAGSRAAGMDVSAYIVRGVMIDTGFHRARAAVDAARRELRVQAAIVTHWHEDHAGNVALLAWSGMPLLVRPDTEITLRERPPIQLYRRIVWGHPPALEGSLVRFESDELQIVHAPGHSPDHQIVFDRQTGTLFSGDLWLGVRTRVLHASEDPYEIARSLALAAALSPARMFDAHRGLVERPVDALTARRAWLLETLGEVERRIGEGWSDAEIVKRVLGGEERTAYVSRGDYSRRNLVRAVRRRGVGP
ncbi:MAG TPA: MBL fold metallo-hydrolase [Gemmatimonadaceae bacterium]|nr:MBL fold metallo-hydrolase [Gemmatimonadaceae bacterium]